MRPPARGSNTTRSNVTPGGYWSSAVLENLSTGHHFAKSSTNTRNVSSTDLAIRTLLRTGSIGASIALIAPPSADGAFGGIRGARGRGPRDGRVAARVPVRDGQGRSSVPPSAGALRHRFDVLLERGEAPVPC